MTLEEAKVLFVEYMKKKIPSGYFTWSEHKIGDAKRTKETENVLDNGFWAMLNLVDDGHLKNVDDMIIEFMRFIATETFKDDQKALDRLENILYEDNIRDIFSATMQMAYDAGFKTYELDTKVLTTLLANYLWIQKNIDTYSMQEEIERLNEMID